MSIESARKTPVASSTGAAVPDVDAGVPASVDRVSANSMRLEGVAYISPGGAAVARPVDALADGRDVDAPWVSTATVLIPEVPALSSNIRLNVLPPSVDFDRPGFVRPTGATKDGCESPPTPIPVTPYVVAHVERRCRAARSRRPVRLSTSPGCPEQAASRWSPPSVDLKMPRPASESADVLPRRYRRRACSSPSRRSTTPIALVPNEPETFVHDGVEASASSVRQTPPPAAPTQSRQLPDAQVGATATAVTRPRRHSRRWSG